MAHVLYGRPRSHLNYEETLALSQLEQAFPQSRQNAETPIPGKPGHFYPAGTKEFLQRKAQRFRAKPNARPQPAG